MTSNDMRFLVNDEQAFKVYVITKLEGMEQRLTTVESEQKDMRAEIKVLAENQATISAQIARLDSRVEMSLWAMGIGFTLMTVFIGVVGVFVPLFLNRKKDSSSAPDMSEYVKVSEFHSQLDREFKLRGL